MNISMIIPYIVLAVLCGIVVTVTSFAVKRDRDFIRNYDNFTNVTGLKMYTEGIFCGISYGIILYIVVLFIVELLSRLI